MQDLISKKELDRMAQVQPVNYFKDFPFLRALIFHVLCTLLPIIVGFGFGTGLIDKWYAWAVIAMNGWLQGVIMSFKWTRELKRQKGYL